MGARRLNNKEANDLNRAPLFSFPQLRRCQVTNSREPR